MDAKLNGGCVNPKCLIPTCHGSRLALQEDGRLDFLMARTQRPPPRPPPSRPPSRSNPSRTLSAPAGPRAVPSAKKPGTPAPPQTHHKTDGRTSSREWTVEADTVTAKAFTLLLQRGAPLLRERGAAASPGIILSRDGEPLLSGNALPAIVTREARYFPRPDRPAPPLGLQSSRTPLKKGQLSSGVPLGNPKSSPPEPISTFPSFPPLPDAPPKKNVELPKPTELGFGFSFPYFHSVMY